MTLLNVAMNHLSLAAGTAVFPGTSATRRPAESASEARARRHEARAVRLRRQRPGRLEVARRLLPELPGVGEDQAPHHHFRELEVGLDLAERLLGRAEVGDHVRAAVALLHRIGQLAL